MAERKPIIVVRFAKIKEAFYKLSEEEKKEFMFKDREKLDELGGKIVMICDCRWSNEEWQFFGVEEWPTIEALEKYTKFLAEELSAYKYAESKPYLGTREIAEYGKV